MTYIDKSFTHGVQVAPNVTNQSISMDQTLINNGYSQTEETGVYVKDLPNSYKIMAFINEKGVILHLANENGEILTRIKQPTIYPTKQIDNPSDILEAEKELCGQINV